MTHFLQWESQLLVRHPVILTGANDVYFLEGAWMCICLDPSEN